VSLVTYERTPPLATITMDDGKVNALSPAMLAELHAAFDRAREDGAIVVLAGRPGVFSAGFDLGVLRGGTAEAPDMLRSGFELSERLLTFPTPVVVACTGHALAMGLFLLLAGDHRLGVAGPYKLGANEVAIGMTLPRYAIEICRLRLNHSHFHRATVTAEIFDPEEAGRAGILDRVVPAEGLAASATAAATRLAGLDLPAFAATKQATRAAVLPVLRAAIEADDAAFRGR